MSLRSTLFRVSAFFVFFDFEADFDPDFGVDFEPHSVVDFDLAFLVKLSFFFVDFLGNTFFSCQNFHFDRGHCAIHCSNLGTEGHNFF